LIQARKLSLYVSIKRSAAIFAGVKRSISAYQRRKLHLRTQPRCYFKSHDLLHISYVFKSTEVLLPAIILCLHFVWTLHGMAHSLVSPLHDSNSVYTPS
jgi:hypothetical protein